MSGFDQLKLQRSTTKIIAAMDQRITELEEALREIANTNGNRPYNWCLTCKKWTDAKYTSGSSWCPACKNDLYSDSAEARYEEIATEALQ